MIGGGIGGFFIAGPVGAFAGGTAGGIGMDALTTHIESKIHGEVKIKTCFVDFYICVRD